MSVLLAALMQLSSAAAGPTLRIEVDEDADRFRIVLTSDVALQFDATAFDIAHEGLAPNSVGVLVRQGNGNVIGRHAGDFPSYSSQLSSQSRSIDDVRMVTVGPGHPFVTDWTPSETLFRFFDEQVSRQANPTWRDPYTHYKIVVSIDTTEGVVAANTPWLVFDDFPTSAFGGRRKP
jgi:hypothetical protein